MTTTLTHFRALLHSRGMLINIFDLNAGWRVQIVDVYDKGGSQRER